MPKKILIVFGTRPEAIKLAPLISRLKNNSNFDLRVCNTGQHKELLDPILTFFDIKVDYNLNVMEPNQELHKLTSKILIALNPILKSFSPYYVVVHGDTTTAFSAALTSFYSKIKVIHVEAGLRTHNLYSPFPEELNRTLISSMSYINFAPTIKAKQNLESEMSNSNIIVTGNTVIDSLFDSLLKIGDSKPTSLIDINFDPNKKIILFTGHRRENFGEGFEKIFNAIKHIINNRPDVNIIYPIHPNPNIKKIAEKYFGKNNSVKLISPLNYQDFIWLMKKCYIVVTDSGGIQEEAPSLGKPVIVTREYTERQEAIDAGAVLLVGTETNRLIESVNLLLDDSDLYNKMAKINNPYGDGKASNRIIEYLEKDE